MRKALILTLFATALAWADVSSCACDPQRPETMKERACGLCREAEAQPPDAVVFLLKDNNPRKPNRWLVLPRLHSPAHHAYPDIPARVRLTLWKTAIAKGRELWGDQWGVAMNGDKVRTQCHTHIHVGKLLKGVETGRFIVVNGPAQIPVPRDGTGMWVHPAGKKLHVHLGEQTCETVLFR